MLENETTIPESVREMVEELRESMHQMLDSRIDAMLERMEQGEALEEISEMVAPLRTHPSFFKGQKPVAVVFPDGYEVQTPTWKKFALAVMRDCIRDESNLDSLLELRGRLSGKNRPILSAAPDTMDAPLKITEDLYMESKYDTETLLHVLTNRILDVVGYDYGDICVRYVDTQEYGLTGWNWQMGMEQAF